MDAGDICEKVERLNGVKNGLEIIVGWTLKI